MKLKTIKEVNIDPRSRNLTPFSVLQLKFSINLVVTQYQN